MSREDKIRLLLIILLFLAIIALFIFMKSCDRLQSVPEEKALDFVELPEPEYTTVHATDSLYFKCGTTYQTVDFQNPKENKCYFVIRILLSDDTEIYRSDYLSPGDSINEIELNQTLRRGIYEHCLLIYSCYSIEDKQEQNGSQFEVSIYSN